RAVSAPINIWNDHQDSMAVRDSGWIQLHCADNQEAIDTTIQAFRISEATELPVMVCMDGFILTHTLETLEMPSQDLVDKYLPPFKFARKLDPRKPLSLGALLGPKFFTEIRHVHHQALLKARNEIIAADRDWAALTGRACGEMLTVEGPEDAPVGILTMGSVVGTMREAIEVYPQARKVKLIKLRGFRPFPEEELRQACEGLEELVVLERALSPGSGGIVATEVRAALCPMNQPPVVHGFAVGLGGRDVPLEILPRLMAALAQDARPGFSIIDVELDRIPAEDR
ncbi:MAG: hypothetical protein K2Q10_08650, partial [Rhodospirillales bacterium]|nr:hypothetical protein [Rhodospirillales bacterium]